MNIVLRLCKLALSAGDLQWALEDFTDDPSLDIIDQKLRSTILSGQINSPCFCPTITVKDIVDDNTVIVQCISGYNEGEKCILMKRFKWDMQQLELFINYIEDKGIEAC